VKKGSGYSIAGGVPHELVTGDAPTVVLDVFVPDREDFKSEALPADRR